MKVFETRAGAGVPFVHVAVLPSVANTIEALGYSSRKLFGKFGLSVDEVNERDGVCPAYSYVRLLHDASRYTGAPDFGVLSTIGQPLSTYGILGYLAETQPNLVKAWSSIAPFHDLVFSYRRGGVSYETDFVDLHCEITWPDAKEAYQPTLRAATYMVNLLRYFAPAVSPYKVSLPFYMLQKVSPFETLGLSTEYEGQRITIRIPLSVGHAAKEGDGLLAAILTNLLRNAPRSTVKSLIIDTIEAEIREELRNGAPTIARIAERMSMGVRELHRKIGQESDSFSAILERCRHDLARHYLRDQDLSIGEVASLLGYANQSAFTRAFERWAGMSPRQYRGQQT